MRNYYGVDDYARIIYYSENCSFANDGSNGFENDEIKAEVNYKESKYNTVNRYGKMLINYKNDLDQEKTISVNVISYKNIEVFFGNYCGFFIDSSIAAMQDDYISIWGLDGHSNPSIQLDNKENTPSIKVSIYDGNEFKNDYLIDISNLSIDFLINKMYELMVNGVVDKDTLNTFNRSFEIVKPCLVLRISELVKNWTEIITKPAKETADKIADLDKQIEELKKKQEKLVRERDVNQAYLDSIIGTIDSVLSNSEKEYGHDNEKNK